MFKGRKSILVYAGYLVLLGAVAASIKLLGLNTQVGLGIVLGIAALYAIFWPRW
ncbi:hypothetical protein [Desulfofalx alkaliphila]|uniref:hypothetical protein n=1 Tax=Desulfofalx alkaliphila TaxID=105483 RepID=UPI000A72B3D9|nr:hypothetical protein [Desulfofalx alkaliphila]